MLVFIFETVVFTLGFHYANVAHSCCLIHQRNVEEAAQHRRCPGWCQRYDEVEEGDNKSTVKMK